MQEFPVLKVPDWSQQQAQLLEQLSDQEFWQHAHQLAQPSPPNQVETHLIFTVDQYSFLLPLTALCEIISSPCTSTRLPTIPSWMMGIMTWHMKVIPVIDFSAYFTQSVARSSAQFLLVTQQEDLLVGLCIDHVESIIGYDVAQVDPFDFTQSPFFSRQISPSIIQGIYKGAFVLDEQALLPHIIEQIRVMAP